MLASRIPLKRCTAAVPGEGEPPAAESMPPAKRRRERVVPSRFRDTVVPPPAKKGCRAGAPGVEVGEDGDVYDVEVRAVATRGAAFGAVETVVWTGEDPPAQTEEVLYRACRNISRSSSSGAFSGSVVTSVSNAGGNGGLEGRPVVVECKPKREGIEKREGFYWPEDFVLGDVVWARSGKKCPAWPALVIDPLLHAPEVVLNSCIPDALYVMFFGYSAGGHGRGQPLYKLKPRKFRAAIEEAFLAERGFFELQMDGGARWRSLSMTILSLMAYRRGLVRIMSKSVNLRLRLLVNQQHAVIVVVIAFLSFGSWTIIAAQFKDKTARQCRRRWYNYLNSECKKGGWSQEEDMLLCEAQKVLGNKWTEIAKVVSGRTDNAVKNRFSTLCKKWAKDEELFKENGSLCSNANAKRVLTQIGYLTSGAAGSSQPLKQMRSCKPDFMENIAPNVRLFGQEKSTQQDSRQPLAIISPNNQDNVNIVETQTPVAKTTREQLFSGEQNSS